MWWDNFKVRQAFPLIVFSKCIGVDKARCCQSHKRIIFRIIEGISHDQLDNNGNCMVKNREYAMQTTLSPHACTKYQ